MTKQEFKDMCHKEFVKRGFRKKGKSYIMTGSDGLRCALTFQSSYGVGYYINCDFYLSDVTDADSSVMLPDISGRVFRVLSKDTVKGRPFMRAGIYYNEYSANELIPYIEQAFEEYVMPPLEKGRAILTKGIGKGIWHFTPQTSIGLEDIIGWSGTE